MVKAHPILVGVVFMPVPSLNVNFVKTFHLYMELFVLNTVCYTEIQAARLKPLDIPPKIEDM